MAMVAYTLLLINFIFSQLLTWLYVVLSAVHSFVFM